MASFKRANGRRLDLIDRKHHGAGLTGDEAAELARLQAAVADYIARKFPRDTGEIDEQAARIEAIIARRKGENGMSEIDQLRTEVELLTKERDEARARYHALDDVETDLWEFACDVVNGRHAPDALVREAARLVFKYDKANPPDVPWAPPTASP
jgi:hypothetical protein